MAITDNITGQAETAAKAFEEKQSSRPEAKKEEAPIKSRSWGLSSTTMFGAPIGRGVGSDYVIKLVTGLTEAYKEATDSGYDVSVLTIDNQTHPSLAFTCLAVCVSPKVDKNRANDEKIVAAHLLIIEATGSRITPILENINGAQVEIMRVAGDALDNVLFGVVIERLGKAFPGYRHVISEGEVVPASFDLDDKGLVHGLAANAASAAGTDVVMNMKSFTDIDLRTEKDTNLIIDLEFNKLQLRNAVGLPIRSDVIINFSNRRNTGNRNFSVNTNDRENKVSEISGFVDVLYNPQNNNALHNPYYAQPQQQMNTQMYSPRFVMTDIHSEIAATPGSILLAISTASALAKDLNWVLAFRPVITGNNIDVNDIGALNYEANLGREQPGQIDRINTKAENFTPMDLGAYISAIIRPGLIISMDCPEAGPQSSYLSVFAAAAAGYQKAIDIVVAAADTLTGGNFSKHLNNQDALFINTNTRIHLGYWIDNKGDKRDLRDVDLIYVANMVGGKNPRAIADWSDTTLNQNRPLPVRMQEAKRMIMALTSETAVFTGFAQRITFSAAFLNALNLGIRDAGIGVAVNTPLPSSDFQNQRGTAAVLANAAQFIPNQSFMNNGGYAGQGQVYSGPTNQFNNRYR